MSVSVVIPTYHRNDFLVNRALASVLRQTVKPAEIIVVHDGNDPADIDRLRSVLPGGVTLLSIPRQHYPEDPGQRWCVLGLNARNRGLDYASGDYIAPLDDDDEWTDDHIEVLQRAVELSGADFAYGMSQYHWPDKRFQTAGSWPPGMGAFCDGAQLYRNGMGYRYDPDCISRGLPEDGDLWTRMFEGGVKFTFTARIVHHYYPNPR